MNLFENALDQHMQLFSILKGQTEKVRRIGELFIDALAGGKRSLSVETAFRQPMHSILPQKLWADSKRNDGPMARLL